MVSDEKEIGSESVGALNDAKQEIWNQRPVCCDEKVTGFDEGYICLNCESVFE